MVTKAKKWLARALILSLILGQIFRLPLDFLGLAGVVITPLDLITFFLLLVWLLGKPRFKTKLFWPIFLFLGIGLFSLIFNQTLNQVQFLTSFLYLLRFAFLVGIYFVVSDFTREFKAQLLKLLAGVGIIIVILGLGQYFLYPDLRNLAYAGWDEHLYRVFSVFLDPNFAGAFFVLVFVLILGLGFGGIFSWIFLLSIMIALLLTYSRGAFLMFFISTSVLLLLLKQRVKLFLILSLFIFGIWLLPKNLPSEGVKLLRTASVSARAETAQNALAIFREKPILGVGFNAYRVTQEQHGFLTVYDSHSAGGTDNSFLFVLATTGILGFLVYLFFWFKILRPAKPIAFASILGLLVNSFFINSLFYPSILVFLFVLIGATEKK